MKTIMACVASILFVCSVYAEKAPEQVYGLAQTEIAALGADPVIIDAVKAANSQGKSLDQIKAQDEEWQKTPGIADFMQSLMDTECAKRIKSFRDSKPYFSEIFVMDNQGANVAMTDKTSDYWQGDEAKFQKSFNNGAGSIFVDEVKFDDSTQGYLVQVSVPVKDGETTIGTITVGIDVDALLGN